MPGGLPFPCIPPECDTMPCSLPDCEAVDALASLASWLGSAATERRWRDGLVPTWSPTLPVTDQELRRDYSVTLPMLDEQRQHLAGRYTQACPSSPFATSP